MEKSSSGRCRRGEPGFTLIELSDCLTTLPPDLTLSTWKKDVGTEVAEIDSEKLSMTTLPERLMAFREGA